MWQAGACDITIKPTEIFIVYQICYTLGQMRISHGKQATGIRVIEVLLYIVVELVRYKELHFF